MHKPRRAAVRAAVVVLLCCLGHPAQGFLPSGGVRVVSDMKESSATALQVGSTSVPTEATARDVDAPSSPVAQRRSTWVQPFVSNPPIAVGGTTAHAESWPGDAPTFLYRRGFYDLTTASPAVAAAPASPDKAAVKATTAARAATSSPAASTPSSPTTAAAFRKTWVQPSHPPTPVDTATAKSASGRAESLPSRPGSAPTFLNRPAHYDLSASAAATSSEQAAVTAARAATSSPAASTPSSPTTAAAFRKTWVQPSQPPTPVDTATAKSASGRAESLPSRPGSAPTFLNRPAHYDLSASAAATSSEQAAVKATAGGETTSSSVEEEQAPVAAAAAAPVSASSSSSDAAASAAAALTPSSPKTADPSPEEPVAAEEATPPPPAAKAASPPPPPVEFEPEPTLLSDSPVYQDVALTIKRAKETLAPFRKKIQDNVAEGNVGERGEEWAVAQAVILLFVAMGSVPLIGGLINFLAGPGLVAGGIGVCAAGLKGLGKSLSPWPAPIEDNELNTEGIYGMMRHPMYTGLVMFVLGFGVVTDSPLRMLLAVVLALVLDRKADKEEKMLIGFHGRAYEDYRKMVAKFVPRFY